MINQKFSIAAVALAIVAAPVFLLLPASAVPATTVTGALAAAAQLADSSVKLTVTGADLEKCIPGSVPAEVKGKILAAINAARGLNGLAAIKADPALDEYAQAATTYLARNAVLTHNVEAAKPCYSDQAASAAAHAVLAQGPAGSGAASLTGVLINDDLASSALGHRVQLLDPSLATTGIGVNFDKNGKAYLAILTNTGLALKPATTAEAAMTNASAVKPELIAWPSEGNFAHSLLPISPMDQKNTWSASLKGKFAGEATVTVTGPKGEVPVSGVKNLVDKYLSGYSTIAFQLPNDLPKPAETDTYTVTVKVGDKTVQYPVKLVVAAAQPLSVPTIVTQPKSVTVAAGEAVTIEVVAAGEQLTYIWEESATGGKDWTPILAADGKTPLAGPKNDFKFAAAANGTLIRVLAKNSAGTATSNPALVNISGVKPVIVTQPADVKVTAGQPVQVAILAAGSGLTYKWEESSDQGKTWQVKDDKTKNLDQAQYTFEFDKTANGQQMRITVSNDQGSVTSRIIAVTVTEASTAPSASASPSVTPSAAPSASAAPTTSATPTPTPTGTPVPPPAPAPEPLKPNPDAKGTLSKTTLVAGETLTVTASGFAPGERVQGVVHSKVVDLGVREASQMGELTWKISTRGLETGKHTVTLTGVDSKTVVKLAFTLKAGLPQTGFNVPVWAWVLGGIAVLGGLGLVVFGVVRRKQGR